MARREITQYFDDLNNTPLTPDKLHVIRFSVDGIDYVMDLSAENADMFREALKPYIAAARRDAAARGRRRAAVPTSMNASRARTRAIREWAHDNGYTIAERGKIPATIIEAYDNAHSN
ncbi:Lsr2 family protein [Corynebacterium canis]|uniref:Lsr2 family protein n=1 Tax=Corynebacterium canis TaxID=679663 RepID=A0A5C5U9K0_9CORY|nr:MULTISPECIES: Lsr2 family protein [Corynebacterium]MDO4685246.1 Lsr2 family protein [Corynebacterium sp.]TWT22744.1 Lsr2 family protein [Corynebacterium canis]WJY76463.1 Nucleoid-associated protein Lsr2 [Corynebacterium canis]WJZ03895.1 Nucleoid-associated protein Lsr2 [Corynebacterium freiburgense]